MRKITLILPSTSTPATGDRNDNERWSTAEYAFTWKFVLIRSLILRRWIRASLTEYGSKIKPHTGQSQRNFRLLKLIHNTKKQAITRGNPKAPNSHALIFHLSKGSKVFFILQLLHRSSRWYVNGTLSPMQGISPSLYPPIHSQRTATTPGTSCCVGSLASHIELINMEGICETGPTVYCPYSRRLESLTICWFNYKGSTFYSVILRQWVLVQPELNSRPPTWQPSAPPTEPPVHVFLITFNNQ